MHPHTSERDLVELGQEMWEALKACEEADGFCTPQWDRARAAMAAWADMINDRFMQAQRTENVA